MLVQPAGNGAMRVIGGAGGKLNSLKLHGVRSEAEYKADDARRDKDRRAQAEEKRAADRAEGTARSKTAARDALRLSLRVERDSFVQTWPRP